MNISLIIGDENEHQIATFAHYLRNQKQTTHCVALSDFPQKMGVSWSPDCGSGILHLKAASMCFSQIKSIYWHRAEQPDQRVCSQNTSYINKEMQSALSPLLHCSSIRWINSFRAIQYHQNKPRQLNHAVRLGATIPPTYIGNNALQASQFLAQHPICIFKPVQSGAITKVVTQAQRQMPHLQQALVTSPVTLQSCVGYTNIRTYVIGNELFSAELVSKTLDFRDDETTEARVVELPFKQRELARRICRGFGMEWCAIDWRLAEDGTYYFLEANPCPYFTHFEEMTSLPICKTLGLLLTH